MWKGKPNCVCTELEWLNNYGGHIERLKSIKGCMKISKTPKYNLNATQSKIRQWKHKQINNENLKILKRILDIDKNYSLVPNNFHRRKCSLNICNRRRAEQQISEENLSLLSRLQKTKSVYSNKEWENSHKKHLIMKHNISHVNGNGNI